MTSSERLRSVLVRQAGTASLFVLLLTAITARAQTYTILHNFTGQGDGANPLAGLTMDRAGNFYGTASYGGYSGGGCDGGCGVVFKLSRSGSGWTMTPVYTFQGGNDGALPNARVVFGPDGSLYGTTYAGGGTGCAAYGIIGCGTVFRLRPPARACQSFLCTWTETVLHRFNGSDGSGPDLGDLVFDQAGNLYGTTLTGGLSGGGVVYKLSPASGWTETVLWNFTGGSDGGNPTSGVILDNAGNLYGTNLAGVAYELVPSASGWTAQSLAPQIFLNQPWGGLVFDPAGNLFGTTLDGGNGNGSIFELTPGNGEWQYQQIYSLAGYGGGPTDSLILDSEGNLYGTSNVTDPYGGAGGVFKVMRGGTWTYIELHSFNTRGDGSIPYGSVVRDAGGNLYGTASMGGTGCSGGCGVVWEITP